MIPAFFLTLFPYFRIQKKYRRNRNRIISMVLHLVIMVFCITVLSGMYFTYDTPNTNNEVLILVDMSYSNSDNSDMKDDFVKSVIDESASQYRVGVVTFGYNQVYAAPFSTDTEEVYKQYINAELPDMSATDVSSALNYARSLFTSRAQSKIVLLSDGAETDGDAQMAVRSLAAHNIQVNTVFFPNDYSDNEMQLIDIVLPENNVKVDEEFKVNVTVQCRNSGVSSAILKLFVGNEIDGEKEVISQTVTVKGGTQNFEVGCTLTSPGLHRIKFTLSSENDDELQENNEYYSYVYIESFNSVLIIERDSGESDKLKDILSKDYTVDVVDVSDKGAMPSSLDALRKYDEIIMFNVANRDMPSGFDAILYDYANKVGGGVLTVGGNYVNEYGKTVANMYDRQDMAGTLYQEMLPVQAVDYTPPLGVMLIIDRSGSMNNKLQQAKEGAIAALYALSERDYCGVMTLDTEFNIEQNIIPATQQARLIRTINDIQIGGGTMYSGAIRRAGEALKSCNVQRRHIILISDGQPGENYEDYASAIRANFKSDITFSMVAIGISDGSKENKEMEDAAKEGGGRYYRIEDESLSDKMSQELKLEKIKDMNQEEFRPKINDYTTVVNGIKAEEIPILGGFYGVKEKEGVVTPLMSAYAPVYSQWNFGQGRVGSFMCDLNGVDWSKTFMQDAIGQKILCNIVYALLPSRNIRPNEITAEFKEKNYTTNVSIYTDLKDGDRVELTVTSVPVDGSEPEVVQKLTPSDEEGFSRMTFAITKAGIYNVTISKLDADGKLLAQLSTFKAFSYSDEYNMFLDMEECENRLIAMAQAGHGQVINISEPWSVFEGMEKSIHNKVDPRIALLIISIILFLLDIAVRKFKFKWLHEIIRERKELKKTTIDQQ